MEHVLCNLCQADDTTVRFESTMPIKDVNGHPANPEHFYCTTLSYGQHYRIVQCRQCGLIYTDPRRRPADMMNDYEAVVDTRYLEEREGRILTFSRNIRSLEEMVPSRNGHRLLDVGTHVGVFVEVAQSRGWDAWGLEPSKWAVDIGRKNGLNMIQGTLHDAELDPATFDVVTMWDVVEHLADPMADIQEVTRILKPGGIFCVHTMNVDSFFARLMGKRWPWLVEMHLYFFSPKTLRAMVEKAGLKVESWQVQGRYLHLGYLLSRLSGWIPALGRLAERLTQILHIDRWVVPVNFGDLFTLYARKPKP
ncbi:MAG: class I SAM-dependent methyltransferase [Anaerolineae bacterium]|nr:class I SAM-dependent methyltransferase [Anaerolineae bacterium]